MSTFNATSVATKIQNVDGRGWPCNTCAMSLMMYCATLATPNGRTATMTRSPSPHDTTAGPGFPKNAENGRHVAKGTEAIKPCALLFRTVHWTSS